MLEVATPLYPTLTHLLVEGARQPTPTVIIPPLLDRNDNLTVFDEGQRFSGIASRDGAQACFTLAASPHVPATIATDKLVRVCKDLFKKDVLLPSKLMGTPEVPAHFIVWWKQKDDPTLTLDLREIALLEPTSKDALVDTISSQVRKAVEISVALNQRPSIYGSWGYTKVEERAKFGLSRGGPTNPLGHLHVCSYPTEPPLSENPTVDEKEQLNHINPLGRYIHSQFGNSFAYALEMMTHVKGGKDVKVNSNQSNGYDCLFPKSISYQDALKLIADTVGGFENWYQQVFACWSDYQKGVIFNQPDFDLDKLIDVNKKIGLNIETALAFSKFVLTLKPTLGQLTSWQTETTTKTENSNLEREIERYRRVQRRVQQSPKRPLHYALLEDIYQEPQNALAINHTLSLHFSGFYSIEDFSLEGNDLMLNKLTLTPCIATTETYPEQRYQAVLKRRHS